MVVCVGGVCVETNVAEVECNSLSEATWNRTTSHGCVGGVCVGGVCVGGVCVGGVCVGGVCRWCVCRWCV